MLGRFGIAAMILLAGSSVQAAPVTFNYSLPCFIECRAGWGDKADISLTVDNSSFTAWRGFGRSALIDFSVTSGAYKADLSDMVDAAFSGTWSNRATSLPKFSLWASQNFAMPGDFEHPRKGLTVNLVNPFYGDSTSADLGRAGSMNTMADYATFASPKPIPVPPTAALIASALLALVAVTRLRKPAAIPASL